MIITNVVLSAAFTLLANFSNGYRPDAPLPAPARPRYHLAATDWTSADTNLVLRALKSRLWFCERLGLKPESGADLAAVNWGESVRYTNALLSATTPCYSLKLTNGVRFSAIRGVAVAEITARAYYCHPVDRGPDHGQRLVGTAKYRWQDLTAVLERRFVEQLHLPATLLARFGVPTEGLAELGVMPEPGARCFKRLLVEWWPRKDGGFDCPENGQAIDAEFDLETGELMFVDFRTSAFAEALAAAQRP